MKTIKVDFFGAILPSEYKDWYGEGIVCASDIMEKLDDVEDNNTVEFLINSPGGSVVEGHAILTLVQNLKTKHNLTVIANIISECASEAVYFAMGCDKVIASFHAMMMIHNVSTGAYGNQYDLESATKTAKDYDSVLAQMIAAKTSLSEEEVMQKYLHGKSDVTINMQEALQAGLIQEIYNTPIVTGNKAVDNQSKAFQNFSPKQKENFIRKEILNLRNNMANNKPTTQNNGAVSFQIGDEQAKEAIASLNETVERLNLENSNLTKKIGDDQTRIASLEQQIVDMRNAFEKERQETENAKVGLLAQLDTKKKEVEKANANTQLVMALSVMKTKAGVSLNAETVQKIVSDFNKQHIVDLENGNFFAIKLYGNGEKTPLIDTVQNFATVSRVDIFEVRTGNGYTSNEGNKSEPKQKTFEELNEELIKNPDLKSGGRSFYQAYADNGFADRIPEWAKKQYGII